MDLFTTEDFSLFDIPGFNERMAAILLRIRPKLTTMGQELTPAVVSMVDLPLFVHVAKHARRTVNPPDDTWAAIGADKRGYKKDVHFKVAVSRNCVRFLFESGPEYYDKAEWAHAWRRESRKLAAALRSARGLGWFKDEHDESPAALLKDMAPSDLASLSGELTRRRDGQFVLGRRLEASDVAGMKAKQFKKTALETFESLSPLFQLHDLRM